MNANIEVLGECVLRHLFANRQSPPVCGPNAKKNHMNTVVVGLALQIHIQHAMYGFEC
jgi:hypothetical protein